MPYPIPGGPVDREIEINKSRFIAWLRPVRSREEGLAVLAEARRRYPDASHHCYGWLIGPPSSGQGAMNDDGEPSGTAGKPIFNVIQHKGVGDVMVLVTRYFGGVKLGAGGLVRAYAGAAEAVLSAMEIIEQAPESRLTLRLDFAQEQPLRHWCEQHGARIESVDYGQGVTIVVVVADQERPELAAFCGAQGVRVE